MMNLDDIKFNYIKEPQGEGILTIASILTKSMDDECYYAKLYTVGIAYQSEEDKFVKSTGREIALSRLIVNYDLGNSLPVEEGEIKANILMDFISCFLVDDIKTSAAPYRAIEYFTVAEFIMIDEFFESRKSLYDSSVVRT